MRKKNLSITLIIGALALATPVAINTNSQIVLAQKRNGNAKKTKLSDGQIIKNLGVKSVANPENDQLTQKYAEIVRGQKYTWENPYLKVNPYKNSPLTALMIFHTDHPTKISYQVQGISDHTTISNKVDGYQTEHQVPIVGLYAGFDNTVTLTMTDEAGNTQTKTVKIKTSKLPKWIRTTPLNVTKNDKSKMQIGSNELTVLNRTTKQTYAVDADGQVRWYYLRWNEHVFEQLHNGHLLMYGKIRSGDGKYNLLVETDYLGRVYHQISLDKTLGGSLAGTQGVSIVHHDVAEMPNGHWLITVDDGSKYVEDTIAELDPKTCKIVKVIDFKKVFPSSMYTKSHLKAIDKASAGLGLIDWMHLNTIDYDAKTNNVILSSRNQDMIWSMNYRANKLNWIFTSKPASKWPKSYRKYLLKPTKGTKYTGGQHGVYKLSQSGDVLKIMLYDNNVAVTNGDKKQSKKFSQGAEYEINTRTKSIKQIWSYGKQLGKANFTNVIGYSQRLANGNTLIDFGYKDNGNQSNIIEVDPSGQQVFNLTTYNSAKNKTYVYRAYRMKFYPDNYVFDALK